jgi:small subunit ribosomal protein S8
VPQHAARAGEPGSDPRHGQVELVRKDRDDHKNGLSEFEIELKYANGQPAIREIKRVSKPGRRVYKAVRELTTVANGLGVAILSTPKGVMSDSRAREENVGGEILCNVF